MDGRSLEDFTAGLSERGFQLTSRGHNIYKSVHIPDRRFVIRQRVIRLERTWIGEITGGVWIHPIGFHPSSISPGMH